MGDYCAELRDVVDRARPSTQATAVLRIPFVHPVHKHLGVESFTLADLATRDTVENFSKPQRPQFTLRVLYTGGKSLHSVDFVDYPVAAGSLVTVQPGQIHQFHFNAGLSGQVVIVDEAFLLPRHLAYSLDLAAPLLIPPCVTLDGHSAVDFVVTAEAISRDTNRYSGHHLAPVLLRQRLYTLLALISMAHTGPVKTVPRDAHQGRVVRSFLKLVEKHYMKHWAIEAYATRLAISPKTLTRTCHTWLGCTAKTVIDERLILEAKRLLWHSQDAVAAVADRLGFDETTNFVRFFRRFAGATPGDFRAGRLNANSLASRDAHRPAVGASGA